MLFQGQVTFDSSGSMWVPCSEPTINPPVKFTVEANSIPTWNGMNPPGSNGMWQYGFPPAPGTVWIHGLSHNPTPTATATEWMLWLSGPPNTTLVVSVSEV